jgi:hypothetical protein
MEIVSDHGWPTASCGEEGEKNAFDAFKNERDYIAKNGRMKTTVAAMDWAAREVERLRKALEEINSQSVCAVIATDRECFDMLQNCAKISDSALYTVTNGEG